MKTLKIFLLIILITSGSLKAQNSDLKKNTIQISSYIEDEVAVIEWSTEIEVNTSHFLIEKSNDGIHFEIIGSHKAGSSTYHRKDYSYEDLGEYSEFSEYRVTLITMSGEAIVSEENSDFANYLVK